jgi:hypothetical protein
MFAWGCALPLQWPLGVMCRSHRKFLRLVSSIRAKRPLAISPIAQAATDGRAIVSSSGLNFRIRIAPYWRGPGRIKNRTGAAIIPIMTRTRNSCTFPSQYACVLLLSTSATKGMNLNRASRNKKPCTKNVTRPPSKYATFAKCLSAVTPGSTTLYRWSPLIIICRGSPLAGDLRRPAPKYPSGRNGESSTGSRRR